MRMGEATFRVERRNGRCGATNVNPDTGRRDLDIPGSLRAAFGHKDLGVYLACRESGTVAAGDSVEIPRVDGGAEPEPRAYTSERSITIRDMIWRLHVELGRWLSM